VSHQDANGPEGTTDQHTFDQLAKGLANSSMSRRDALRRVGGVVLGGLLAAIPGVALAAPQGDRGNPAHGRCPAGTTNCQGKCVNLQTNQNNCGQCRVVCSEGELCQGGTCLTGEGGLCSSPSQCAAGLGCRNGICVTANVCTPAETASCAAAGRPVCCATATTQICCPSNAQCRVFHVGNPPEPRPECVFGL
jgi:stigma-specific protein Stig1